MNCPHGCPWPHQKTHWHYKNLNKTMMFKETPDGQTHYYGDGCPEHSNKTPMEEFEELAHAYNESINEKDRDGFWEGIAFAKDFFKT